MQALLRRWSSPASVDTAGFELVSDPLRVGEIAAALRFLHQDRVADGVFLLVRLASTDARGVCAAFDQVQHVGPIIRICLAIDVATLGRIDRRLPNPRNVGLVLDDVDAETPLSAIIRDDIEAIRFSRSFVDEASERLRADAALRAMLGLARDLGLGTLGPACGGEDGSGRAPGFDYVATAGSPSEVGDELPRSPRVGIVSNLRAG